MLWLVLEVGSFFILGVLVDHSGIVGMMRGLIKRLLKVVLLLLLNLLWLFLGLKSFVWVKKR